MALSDKIGEIISKKEKLIEIDCSKCQFYDYYEDGCGLDGCWYKDLCVTEPKNIGAICTICGRRFNKYVLASNTICEQCTKYLREKIYNE